MKINLEYSRPLPPELLAEIHKCLPLDYAVNFVVNVPSRKIVHNNKYWLLRNIRKIKKSLIGNIIHPLAIIAKMNNEEIEQLDNIKDEFTGEMASKHYKSIKVPQNQFLKWVPEMDTFFRYGALLTPTRNFFMAQGPVMAQNSYLFEMPNNFVENLIVHLANSPMSGNSLEFAQIQFGGWDWDQYLPKSLQQLLEQTKMRSSSGSGRILLESIDLKIGQNIVQIFDGELFSNRDGHHYELTLHLVNKVDPTKWFEIRIDGEQYWGIFVIQGFSFSAIQPTNEYIENGCKWSGHYQILQKEALHWNLQMDSFLRRGAEFTHFRHFQIDKITLCPKYYAEELICYMAYTKHPEYVLESMDIKIEYSEMSKMLHQIWNICRSGIPKGGRLLKSDNENLFILAGTAHDPIKGEVCTCNRFDYFDQLEFTLANWHSNFGFLFDFYVIYPTYLRGRKKKTIEIIIKRRKNKMMKLDMESIAGSNNNQEMKKKSAIDGINRYFKDLDGEYKKRKYFFE